MIVWFDYEIIIQIIRIFPFKKITYSKAISSKIMNLRYFSFTILVEYYNTKNVMKIINYQNYIKGGRMQDLIKLISQFPELLNLNC